MHRVYIGLGSNLDNPIQQLQRALYSLKKIPESSLAAVSSFYQSAPWGGISDQPCFINAVVEIRTTLTPFMLLKQLQLIEKKQNRQRNGVRWGPRTLDLDNLLFDHLQLNSPQLTIPHLYLRERDFVVYPLAEIAPDLVLPTGETIKECLMSKIAVYPGTFDPITNGHVDIILRAAKIFDLVIVAVATNVSKTPLIGVDERMALINKVFCDNSKIKVAHLDGLLVNFVRKHNANCILRGLRLAADFDYEFQLAGANHLLAPEIETVFLTASAENTCISATIVREIISHSGDVSKFVPSPVVEYFNSR